MIYFILIFSFLIFYFIINKKWYIENSQDLNLDKEFREKKHRKYEICSFCGKRLKHAKFGKTGDIMMCSVECRGKTTWYCEDCGEKYLNNTPSVPPENYIGDNYV